MRTLLFLILMPISFPIFIALPRQYTVAGRKYFEYSSHRDIPCDIEQYVIDEEEEGISLDDILFNIRTWCQVVRDDVYLGMSLQRLITLFNQTYVCEVDRSIPTLIPIYD